MVGRDEAELRETGAPDDLWRFLVTRPGGPELHPSVAVELFERHHSGGEPGAVDTALLLCTDWRWRRSSADVLAGILRAGILDDAEQDDLAERLLWPERSTTYTPPDGWARRRSRSSCRQSFRSGSRPDGYSSTRRNR